MPPKGVKRTNTSDRSIQNESGNQETKKPSRKKSKQKNKTDSQSNNKGEKGENTGDNISVNKQFKTPISEQSRYGGVNANVNMSQPNFSHDASLFYTQIPGLNPMFPTQNQQLCSSPNPGMYPPPMQNVSPFTQHTTLQQRPVWIDELFQRMDQMDTKLNKLEHIDSFVSSLNAKVVRLEQGVKSLDDRLDQVEMSTQLMSNAHDTQNKNFSDLKTELDKISKQLKSNKSNAPKVDQNVISSINDMKKDNDRLQNELIEVQLKSMCNNLIFYNILETTDEDCPETINAFCHEKLKIENSVRLRITDAYRLGKKGEQIRPILAKFASFDSRDLVKKSAKNLKGSNYGISEQLPVEIQKRRKAKLPTLKRLRDENIKAYFVRDKIYVGGKEYVP